MEILNGFNDRYILDEHGNPIPEPDLLAWGRWMGEGDKRRVAETFLPTGEGTDNYDPNGIRISTVFLGLDHSFGGPEPVLFETMIFGGEHDQFQERYTNRNDAIAGHAIAVSMAKGNHA